MLAISISDLGSLEYLVTSPVFWIGSLFQIWMLIDAIRRREWAWVFFLLIFPMMAAFWYFFSVYRASPSATSGFELPGSHDRRRIKELQAQIHHLDKPHHYFQLGDIYFQKGKLDQAESCYRSAFERDGQDIDIRAHLGQCLLRLKRPAEAKPLLEEVCRENPRHDYGHSLMAYAETLAALGETDGAISVLKRVTENHSYPRARVQLAQLYVVRQQPELARAELKEVLADDPHTPAFQRKRDRPWIRRAKKLLSQIR